MDTDALIPQLSEGETALIAAHQAADATAELLRFTREGPHGRSAFGDANPIEQLAEALLHAGRIAIDHLPAGLDDVYRDEIGQLTAACARFIDGWAG